MFGSLAGSPPDSISDLASSPTERTSFNVDLNLFDEFYLSDPLNTFEGPLPTGARAFSACLWKFVGRYNQMGCVFLNPLLVVDKQWECDLRTTTRDKSSYANYKKRFVLSLRITH